MNGLIKIPLYKVIYNNARYYNKGSILLSENVFQGRCDGDYIAPSILCFSFCIEMLLKSLIVIKLDNVFTIKELKNSPINLRGHSYIELFNKIDNDIQISITETYHKLYGRLITIDGFRDKLMKLGSRNFEKWRYIYETGKREDLNCKLLTTISDSLGKTIENIIAGKKIQ